MGVLDIELGDIVPAVIENSGIGQAHDAGTYTPREGAYSTAIDPDTGVNASEDWYDESSTGSDAADDINVYDVADVIKKPAIPPDSDVRLKDVTCDQEAKVIKYYEDQFNKARSAKPFNLGVANQAINHLEYVRELASKIKLGVDKNGKQVDNAARAKALATWRGPVMKVAGVPFDPANAEDFGIEEETTGDALKLDFNATKAEKFNDTLGKVVGGLGAVASVLGQGEGIGKGAVNVPDLGRPLRDWGTDIRTNTEAAKTARLTDENANRFLEHAAKNKWGPTPTSEGLGHVGAMIARAKKPVVTTGTGSDVNLKDLDDYVNTCDERVKQVHGLLRELPSDGQIRLKMLRSDKPVDPSLKDYLFGDKLGLMEAIYNDYTANPDAERHPNELKFLNDAYDELSKEWPTDKTLEKLIDSDVKNYDYHYKPEAVKISPDNDPTIAHNGPMAQDLQEVFPDAVKEGPGGFLQVDASRMAMPLPAAIKALGEQNLILKERVEKLEAMLQHA